MKTMKKTLAILLSVLMMFSSVSAAAGLISFAADDEASVCILEPSKETPAVPEGWHLTGRTNFDEDGNTIWHIEDEPSEYGLINELWIDVYGNEVQNPDYPLAYPEEEKEQNDYGSALPSSYDSREKKVNGVSIITPVEYQIGGTCWAHAFAACVETGYMMKLGKVLDISEYHLAWYGKNGYYSGVTDSANDGWVESEILNVLSAGGNAEDARNALCNFAGAVTESHYDLYSEEKVPFEYPSEEKLIAKMQETFTYEEKYKQDVIVESIKSIPYDIDTLKQAVLDYGAVKVSYYHDDSYYNYQNNDDGWYVGDKYQVAFYNPEKTTTNHAVTLIGWDDNFSRENFNESSRPSRDGAWLIKNSWSTVWGNNGYFWISYEDKSIQAYDSHVVTVADVNDYQDVYFYDGIGYNISLGSSGLLPVANVFTAANDMYLTKVSYGGTVQSDYELEIYTSLPDVCTDPTAGTLVYAQSGKVNNEMFIDIEGDVSIEKGTKFSVVLKMNKIFFENYKSMFSNAVGKFTVNPGESFVKNAGEWKDTSSVVNFASDYWLNNSCVRAIAKYPDDSGSYKVTFKCGTAYRETVVSEDGKVALPEKEGYTYKFTYDGEDFDGTNVTKDTVVTAHCYLTTGEKISDASCTVEYKCIYCGEKVKEDGYCHIYGDPVVTAPTCTAQGYSTYICYNGDHSYVDNYVDPISHIDNDKNHYCDYNCKTYLGVHADSEIDSDHLCDYGCGETLENCKNGTPAKENTVAATCLQSGSYDMVTRCTICNAVTATEHFTVNPLGHKDEDKNHVCDNGCGIYQGEHKDADKNHVCDYGCTERIGTCADVNPKDHNCDYGCGASFGTHADVNPKDHICDYGCAERIGTCADVNPKDHNCDYGCGATFGTHADSATDKDHVCDYGCGVVLEACIGAEAVKEDIVAADCTTPASYNNVVYCNVCGVKMSTTAVEGEALGHNFVWIVDKAATCGAAGEKHERCTRCGTMQSLNTVISATGNHTYTAKVTAPTCTVDGYTTYTCSGCNASYTGNTVTAPGHSFEWIVDVEANCGEAGKKHEKCKNCDATQNLDTEIPATSVHSYSSVVTAPTCTVDGYTTKTCVYCKHTTITDIVTASGHKFVWIIDEEAGCGKTGVKHEECTVCGTKQSEGTVIPAEKDHSYTEAVTAPTCTNPGYTTYTCECGYSYNGNLVAAKGHSYNVVVINPTCTVGGYSIYTCACGDTYTGAETDVIPHSYTPEVTAPTCFENGYTTYTCVCGNAYVSDIVETKGHSFGAWETSKQATCSAKGEEKRFCASCGNYERRDVEALAHVYSEEGVVTAPTCTVSGYTTYSCINCTATRVDNVVEAIGHKLGSWTIIKDSTCTETGLERIICTVCGKEESREIALKEHKYDNVVVNAPSCITPGYTSHTCVCGQGYTDNIIAPNGHSYGEWTVSKAPTCTEKGLEERICTACGNSETNVLEIIEHAYSTVVTAPTCVAKGYTVYTCTECGYTYKGTYVDATGHSDTDGDSICNTCGEEITAEECTCMCHQGGFMGFIYKIVSFFWKLFKMNPVCECGINHY